MTIKKAFENSVGKGDNACYYFSLPKHEVLRVSFCDRAVSSVCHPSSTFHFA